MTDAERALVKKRIAQLMASCNREDLIFANIVNSLVGDDADHDAAMQVVFSDGNNKLAAMIKKFDIDAALKAKEKMEL